MNYLKYFLLCTFVAGFLACEKEIPQSKDVKEDVITSVDLIKSEVYYEFSDDTSFWAAIDLVGTVDSEELIQFTTKQSGFKSYAAIYYEFLDKINDENITKEIADEIIKEYSDILIIEKDRIRPRIDNPLVQHLINRYGFVKIGNALAVYTESEKIVSTTGDMEALIQTLSSGEEIDDIYRFSYREELKQSSAYCGTEQVNWVNKSDRKATLTCKFVYEHASNGYYSQFCGGYGWTFKTFAYVYGYGEKKRWYDGKWIEYKTINTIDLNYEARTFDGPIHQIIYYKKDTNESYGLSHKVLIHQGVGCLSDQGNYDGLFTRIHLNRFHTRGINPDWVNISCGY